jgi:hypothetical protein
MHVTCTATFTAVADSVYMITVTCSAVWPRSASSLQICFIDVLASLQVFFWCTTYPHGFWYVTKFWLCGCTLGVNGLYVVVGGAGVTSHALVEFWETGCLSLLPSICDPTEKWTVWFCSWDCSNMNCIFCFCYFCPVTCTMAVAQWLRYCATNRKVAGSIPDGVIGIFHWHDPSDRTMALGSTQPLTGMSTRSISWG